MMARLPRSGGLPPADVLVPVPAAVSRRAWECALDLGQEHSNRIGAPALWHWFQAVVVYRDPETMTWAECAALFRAHRHYRAVRT